MAVPVPAALVLGALFAASFSISPLFTSNQNVYFLHGLAQAGVGELATDWFASTPDPFPIFSAIVRVSHRLLGDWVFYVLEAGVLAAYALLIVNIVEASLEPRSKEWGYLLAALLTIAHSRAFEEVSTYLLGWRLNWYLYSGLAGHSVAAPALLPSGFGVLILLSITFYLRGRWTLSVLAGAAAANMHLIYYPPYGCLALLCVVSAARDSRAAGLRCAAIAVVAALPNLIHYWLSFGSSSPEILREAQRILVHERTPHHSVPGVWFDGASVFQLMLMAAGIAAARGTRLLPVIAAFTVAGLVLSAAQLVSGSDALALMFPWRLSVFVVPLSTGMLLGRLALAAAPRFRGCSAGALPSVCVGLMAMLASFAAFCSFWDFQARARAEEAPVSAYIRATLSPGEVYVIPPSLEGFKLRTGAPIVVDLKTHGYRDVDVLDWRERVRRVDAFYSDPSCARAEMLVRAYRAARVLARPGLRLDCPGVRELYSDRAYRVLDVSSLGRDSMIGRTRAVSASRAPGARRVGR